MNGLKYLSSTVLGAILGAGISLKVSKALSKSEEEKLKRNIEVLKMRLSRDPKLNNKYKSLMKKLESINSIPKGPTLAKKKLEFISELNDFLGSLPEKDRKIYMEIQVLTDKISNIKSNTGAIGLFLGGIVGMLIGEQL